MVKVQSQKTQRLFEVLYNYNLTGSVGKITRNCATTYAHIFTFVQHNYDKEELILWVYSPTEEK